MKKLYFIFVLCLAMASNAQIINFTDPNFKAILLAADVTNEIAQNNYPLQDNMKIDANNNGEIEVAEALAVERLNIDNANLTSLNGIEYFANLLFLGCSNNQLTSLDLTFRPYMESIDCSNNFLTEANFPMIVDEGLIISNNLIQTLELVSNTGSTFFILDCKNNPNLESIYIKDVFIETIYSAFYFDPIYLSNCPNLNYICANDADIPNIQTALNANGNVNCVVNSSCNIPPDYIVFDDAIFKARLLEADSSNQIAKNLDGNYFKIDANNDGQIQFTEAVQVSYLYIRQGFSTIVSLQGINFFTEIRELDCTLNSLTQLDVSNISQLEILKCDYNQITSLNINGLTNLVELYCDNNQIENLDLNSLTSLIILNCSDNELSSLNLDNLINLEGLFCNNNLLTAINLTNLQSLKTFYCNSNQITSLDLEYVPNLIYLYCSDNLLTNLNISGLFQLKELGFEVNQISSIDLSNNTLLQSLNIADNLLSSIDLSNVANSLQYLDCSNNQLTSIDLSGLSQMAFFQCAMNPVTNLDLSEMIICQDFYIENNPLLTSLNIKNGINEFNELIFFDNNPSLQYICVDEGQTQDIINKINEYGYTNCQVNSYCSFTPGGAFYTITGNQLLDINNNGCENNDVIFPNMKFSISNGVDIGTIITDTTGNYSIPVQTGTHTITPIIENSSYFTVTPSSIIVNFPEEASPFTQNFCIAPNGDHNDLEIVVLPLDDARPGFDSSYKIIYKNKGTNIQSGAINLVFDDGLLDFIMSNPLVFSQSENNLIWNFTNLQPFETREIGFVINLNSPTETPALNGGDIISYNLTINGLLDETPNDNIALLSQEVVNSFDPNDKTCLEGTTITPDKVGDFVHYKIRFENTGTANAENIVVKDVIDTSKFDISTLIPVDGSHTFVTRITSTNQVEFIFENIQLPFDDANNDGYVVFKIKTKPTLVVGNTISNTASIYFDYNFPIVTNTTSTSIQALGNQDFEFSNYFAFYPNPVKNVLYIDTKSDITISMISIYSTLGQLIEVIPNAKNTISLDVSQLSSGTYFIKILSNKGTSNTKFIKE